MAVLYLYFKGKGKGKVVPVLLLRTTPMPSKTAQKRNISADYRSKMVQLKAPLGKRRIFFVSEIQLRKFWTSLRMIPIFPILKERLQTSY
jgi:hypothetical protein